LFVDVRRREPLILVLQFLHALVRGAQLLLSCFPCDVELPQRFEHAHFLGFHRRDQIDFFRVGLLCLVAPV